MGPFHGPFQWYLPEMLIILGTKLPRCHLGGSWCFQLSFWNIPSLKAALPACSCIFQTYIIQGYINISVPVAGSKWFMFMYCKHVQFTQYTLDMPRYMWATHSQAENSQSVCVCVCVIVFHIPVWIIICQPEKNVMFRLPIPSCKLT